MNSPSNGTRPSAVLNDPFIDLEPLSSKQVREELEAKLVSELDLLPPVVQRQGDATSPDDRPFAEMHPPDQLSQEFQSLSEDIVATVAAMRATLLSMLQHEFRTVYQDVLKVSRELELPVISAADLVADSVADGPVGTQDPRNESPTPSAGEGGEAGKGDSARRSSFVQDRPRQPGKTAQPARPPVQQPEPKKPVLATDESPGAAQNEVFDGTVRLTVQVNGNVRQLLRFVDTLSKKAELRLLRLVGDHDRGVDLWVGLRRPLRLVSELEKMEGVAQVSNVWELDSNEKERHLELSLAEAPVHDRE